LKRGAVLGNSAVDVAFASVKLSTGAELRISGGDGSLAVVCMNGGQRAEVEGTWSPTIEWLLDRLRPQFPEVRFAELRYRIKSWRRFNECVEDARAAIEAAGGERTLLLGFSMGGGVAIAAAAEPAVETVVGLAPWIPPRLPLEGLRGRRFSVIHGTFDRALPGIPGVSPRHSRAGFERARTLGVTGDYTLIPGAVHGVALRLPGLGLVPLPRARRWAELVAAELERS
jgi:pimeloyl-ACP methyl ester carboxylesterase